LAEVHLPNIESEEELKEVVTYLYRINKHSLSLPCHQERTQQVVHNNMRMGIGITGYMMSTKKQKSWLDSTYDYIREYDKKYSKKHGFPESIKLTTVKPSGTLSLLSGSTSGCHPGYSHYFIRRIRMASNIPLVEVCRNNGYKIEYVKNFDGSLDHNTVVVEFPCKLPKHAKVAKDTTAIDQLEIVKELQKNWSDNAVSVTVYYKKSELPAIKRWLKENFNDNIKAVSFLLHSDHGFEQAPYEEITKEQYEEMSKNIKPIINCEVDEDSISADQIGCEGGVCPIK
jgi:ribonucleotide reductase alpha subunit